MANSRYGSNGSVLPMAQLVVTSRIIKKRRRVTTDMDKILKGCDQTGRVLLDGNRVVRITKVVYSHNIYRDGQSRRSLSWNEYVAAGRPKTFDIGSNDEIWESG